MNIERLEVMMEAYVAASEVTSLKHEIRDDTVEFGTSISEALLSGGESTEVLNSFRHRIIEEVEDDAALSIYTSQQLAMKPASFEIEHYRRVFWTLPEQVIVLNRRWNKTYS
jgi:hypothetical protein